MELKSDAGSDPRKRAHMIRRLKKATMHAAELVQLQAVGECTDHVDGGLL